MDALVKFNPSLKEHLLFEREQNGGVQVVFRFPNNYGASVVKHSFSYGVELAVVAFDDESEAFRLVYDTPVTDDVLGHLTPEELLRALGEVKDLLPLF